MMAYKLGNQQSGALELRLDHYHLSCPGSRRKTHPLFPLSTSKLVLISSALVHPAAEVPRLLVPPTPTPAPALMLPAETVIPTHARRLIATTVKAVTEVAFLLAPVATSTTVTIQSATPTRAAMQISNKIGQSYSPGTTEKSTSLLVGSRMVFLAKVLEAAWATMERVTRRTKSKVSRRVPASPSRRASIQPGML